MKTDKKIRPVGRIAELSDLFVNALVFVVILVKGADGGGIFGQAVNVVFIEIHHAGVVTEIVVPVVVLARLAGRTHLFRFDLHEITSLSVCRSQYNTSRRRCQAGSAVAFFAVVR